MISRHTDFDENPVFHYKGRRFEIETDGRVQSGNTHIKIDGIEQKYVTRLVLTLDAKSGIIKVETEQLDV